MPNLFLTPGPSQLYFTVETHLKQALKQNIPSISHRSKAFEMINQQTQEHLRDLLNIPDNFQIFFTASATEVWERIAQNLVINESHHLVNGAFSKRFAAIVEECGLRAGITEAPHSEVANIGELMIPESTELIALTHNETSTGAQHVWDDIAAVRKAFPDQLIALDVVSSAPDVIIDFNDIDTTYFSVQKGFGLPAGLGVWIVNDRCMDKAMEKQLTGASLGSYHSLPSLMDKGRKFQTPETPNVLGIYMLGCIAEDMLTKGMDMIRRETAYKAAVLYQAFESSEKLVPFVAKPTNRSRTTTVAQCTDAPGLTAFLEERGIIVGSGCGSYKNEHIRIANCHEHSKEQEELKAEWI